MIKIQLLIAGLLTVLTVSAISTPDEPPALKQYVEDIPFYKTNKLMVCGATEDVKAELKDFDSVWAGVNTDEDTNKVISIIEFKTSDKKWVIVEHFAGANTSCIIGVGEDWAYNPKNKHKRGTSI